MYNLTLLSPDSFRFVSTFNGSSSKTNELVAIAAARAIVFKLPMPSAKQESPDKAYEDTALTFVRNKISALTDIFALDATRAMEMARKFWMMRYNVAFPSELVFAHGETPTVSYAFGFGDIFADTEIATVKENMQQLAVYINCVRKILDETDPVAAQAQAE